MRSKLIFCVVVLGAVAHAKEPQAYQSGKLLQMDSVQCGMAEKEAKSFAGEMLGTDSGSKKTHELLCQEYVVQSMEEYEAKMKDNMLRALKRKAAAMGFQLSPLPAQ